MKKCLFALLIIAWQPALLAQEPFSSVEERMTGREFQAAGLHKLTAEELEALNAWLRKHSVATLDTTGRPAAMTGVAATSAQAAPAADRRDLPREREEDLTDEQKFIESRYVGTFTGWDGNTVFRLENGMVWKQAEQDVFTVRPPLENPLVTVKRGMFKTWRLSVEGYNSRVRVERLQ